MKHSSAWTRRRTLVGLAVVACVTMLLGGAPTLAVGQHGTAGSLHSAAARQQGSCLELVKEVDGPYRTSDNRYLNDRLIPVAVKFLLNGMKEYIFYFAVSITVTNCGTADLTNVVVDDSYNKEVEPFELSDPANVDFTWEVFNAGNVFTREYIIWTVGTLAPGESRTLDIKVGTEFNNSGMLEPARAGKTLPLNVNRTSVSTDQGLSASADKVNITTGPQVSCAGTEGAWDTLIWNIRTNPLRTVYHDKCTAVTTSLPTTQTVTRP